MHAWGGEARRVAAVITTAALAASGLVLGVTSPAASEPLSGASGEVLMAVGPSLDPLAVATAMGARVVRTVPGRRDLVVVSARSGWEHNEARRLDASPEVRWATPNQVAHLAAAPNDPYFRFQWNLSDRSAAAGGASWSSLNTAINGAGVTVAVIDTGVTAHEDLDGVIDGWDFVDGDADASDGHGHGTHVAGTIAESTGNGVGAAGIAPGASILPLRVLDSEGAGTYDKIIAAIDLAVRRGASVLNLSFVGPTDSGLCEAVSQATAAGVVVVSAAGNDAGPVGYPAACPAAIGVAAANISGEVASYSNRGPQIALAAPGGESTGDRNDDGYPDGILQFSSFDGEGGYYFLSGTSMASPHVAAAAALMRQVAPGLTPDQVRDALTSGAADRGPAGPDDSFGAGLLDIGRSVSLAQAANRPPTAPAPPAPTPAPTPTPTGASVSRVSGANRFGTAAALSGWSFAGGSDRAYVANGRDFADALSTGGLAGAAPGPLLLSETCSLPIETANELRRLAPRQVTLVGGEGALCPALAGQIAQLTGATVGRIAGADRFATSAEASRAAYAGATVPVVYLASGVTFPDGLAGGALAAHGPGPLLLTGSCLLPGVVASELQRLAPQRVEVLGGPAAICDGVLIDVQNLTGAALSRLAGGDRYATAAVVASQWSVGQGTVFIAAGQSFADGLAAGPSAGRQAAPLLLVPQCGLPSSVRDALARLAPQRIVVVGGAAAVCEQTLTDLAR